MAGTSIETTNRKDFPWFINFDADGSLEGRVETAYRELLDDGKWWTEKSPDGAARLCYQFDKFSQGRVRCWSYAIEYDGRTLGRYRLDGSRLKKDWIITTPGPQASAVIAANKATRVAGASQAAQRSAPPVQQPLTAAKDTQPPVIDVPATIAAKGAVATISGQISDASRLIEVTIDGRPVAVGADGSFSARRGVPQGTSTITIAALDELGEPGRAKRHADARDARHPKSGAGKTEGNGETESFRRHPFRPLPGPCHRQQQLSRYAQAQDGGERRPRRRQAADRRHPRRHFHRARAAPGEADARRQSADLLCRARRTGRDRPAGLLAAGGRRKRHPDHGRRAVACALELDQCAQAFVAEQAAQGIDFGATRIGVHTGMAVVGNFGGEARFDYTAHGDTINIAARLEGANKHLGTLICISGATVEQCGDRDFRPVGSLVLKGKTEAVEVFEAIPEELVASPKTAEYSRAFELLKNGRPEARAAFSALAEKYPDDGLIRFHAKRLIAGEATSLIVMEEK